MYPKDTMLCPEGLCIVCYSEEGAFVVEMSAATKPMCGG